MPGAKLGLVDNISRHPNQKLKLSVYEEVFIVAQLELISTSANSLKLYSIQTAPHLHNLLEKHDPAPQITAKS